MPSALDLVLLLLEHRGERYQWGLPPVPKDNPAYRGPWDCAEFVAWGIFQVAGQFVGCQGRRHNAYTGHFKTQLPRVARRVRPEWAPGLIGVIALRPPTDKRTGHIAVGQGGGLTIEAMDTTHGVCIGRLGGRGFTQYYTLDALDYDYRCALAVEPG